MNDLTARQRDLEAFLQVAYGRLSAAKAQVKEEQAGVNQIEGRLMELSDMIASQPNKKKGS